MTFTLDNQWVWDFWIADDGVMFHLFYLHAPKELGDPQLRHRNARVGHATSLDLHDWVDLGVVLGPGSPGDFDETATWTGCVVKGDDGVWRMFYTGSRFLSADSNANVETIGSATSADLHHWTKAPGPIAAADPRWYETLGSSSWPEEAWRDPWVFPDASGHGWHMLITARSNRGDEADRGVIGHATSDELQDWQVHPPLTEPGAGFAHLEVPQVATIDGRHLLLFSCDSAALAGRRATGESGGIWAVEVPAPAGPYDVANARLLASEALYSGRLVQDRSGTWVMLAFENGTRDGEFIGAISDPIRIAWAKEPGSIPVIER
ncbi:glycosyl hydrolase family 32 [Agromyces sp. Soil535]|uniref:glycosyl hydrolase family 32 n=1 Tax=Agromyces sp. Soil535 TaxID=1736390 RepID=UPI0006FE4638|nr:glycosyl hydrolase family 32 [Agromyces sp. Soil535]KRE31384.1 glycosyl hydrolase family 32 [Agromyces sp. Soil535]